MSEKLSKLIDKIKGKYPEMKKDPLFGQLEDEVLSDEDLDMEEEMPMEDEAGLMDDLEMDELGLDEEEDEDLEL